ncbi:MAG: hypothetical protein MHM6MM_005537 [Cercozoa sp. M6MM]
MLGAIFRSNFAPLYENDSNGETGAKHQVLTFAKTAILSEQARVRRITKVRSPTLPLPVKRPLTSRRLAQTAKTKGVTPITADLMTKHRKKTKQLRIRDAQKQQERARQRSAQRKQHRQYLAKLAKIRGGKAQTPQPSFSPFSDGKVFATLGAERSSVEEYIRQEKVTTREKDLAHMQRHHIFLRNKKFDSRRRIVPASVDQGENESDQEKPQFQASVSEIVFDEQCSPVTFTLLNCDFRPRRFAIMPPLNKHYSVSPIRQSTTTSGWVAPGIATKLEVSFAPCRNCPKCDTRGNLQVICQNNAINISLRHSDSASRMPSLEKSPHTEHGRSNRAASGLGRNYRWMKPHVSFEDTGAYDSAR